MATWHEVADRLAERLGYMAYACIIADGDDSWLGSASITEEVRRNHDRSECPFCRDTDAYKFYLRKKAQDGQATEA